jgi:hypothetical protein
MQDVWAGRREVLKDAIARSLEAIGFSHGQLVREQIEATAPGDYEAAALACLAAAEAAGGSAEAALPGAVSMAFLSQMGLVFMGLENSGGAASLSTAWGMPRSLNAGDAMFALAQESLLAAPEELTAEERLQATVILDGGSRDLVDALFGMSGEGDAGATGQRALLPAAMALGALLGGGDEKVRERLAELGREWSALSAEALSRELAGDPRGWLAT